MRSIVLFIGQFIVIFVVLASVGCENILENFSDKNTNEALFVDAQILMNVPDYEGALAKIALMTGSFAQERKVVALKASAYGGICGLNFLTFVDALGSLSSTRLFPLLMDYFRAGTTTDKIDSCLVAEDLIESIGATAARTSDENVLLILVSFAKIGNILSYYADTNQDGAVTAAYNVCAIGGARTAGGNLSDADARQLGTGLTLAINNISAISTEIDLGDASLTAVQDACADLAVLNPAYDFCAVTDPTLFTANQLKGIRSLVKEDQVVGLDTLQAGCNGDVTICNCP